MRRNTITRVSGITRHLLLFAGALAVLPTAHAQSQAPGATLEEIVVTAQRREQSLDSVPLAVSAFSDEDLTLRQVRNLGDLQSYVPNLSLTVGDSMNAVAFIRGVGQRENIAFADPGVGIYVDDVYLGRAQGAFLDILDVDRIEVLRGPQGTLYGRNTIGGAIKYVSAKPPQTASGWAEITGGNFGRLDVKAAIGGPIGDTVTGRISVGKLTDDGYTKNLYNGKRVGDTDTTVWSGSLLARPSDSLQFDLSFDGSRAHPSSARPPILEQPGALSPGVVLHDPYTANVNFADVADLDTNGAALTATWNLDNAWTLKSISAYRQMKWRFHFDVDATPLRTFDVFVEPEHQNQLSQEFQFNYTSGPVTAVGGLYYFREHDVTVQGVYAPDFLGLGFYEADRNVQLNRSYAAYTQLDWAMTPTLAATIGLRYTDEVKDFRRIQEFFGDINFDGIPETPVPTSVANLVSQLGNGVRITDLDIPHKDHFPNTWSDLSPKFGLNWKASEHSLIYANVAKGFKSGGFFGRANASFDAKPYKPEQLWSYELGVKSSLLNKRLQVNGAIFYYDYKDMQVTSFAAFGGALVATFENAAKSTLKGIDLNTTFAATRRLTLDATLSYLDANFDKYLVAQPGGALVNVADQRKLPFTPRWTGAIGATYAIPLNERGDLKLRADWSYRDKTYFEITGSEILSQPGYSLLSASATFSSANGHWRIAAAGQNLTDKPYRDFGFNLVGSGLGQFAYYGRPRSYSLAVRYSF